MPFPDARKINCGLAESRNWEEQGDMYTENNKVLGKIHLNDIVIEHK